VKLQIKTLGWLASIWVTVWTAIPAIGQEEAVKPNSTQENSTKECAIGDKTQALNGRDFYAEDPWVSETIGFLSARGFVGIDNLKSAGFTNDRFIPVYAWSLGYVTFKIKRSNLSGFDLIAAKLNEGVVGDVLVLDPKNTVGEITRVTAMGLSATNPQKNFEEHLVNAIKELRVGPLSKKSFACQVANKLSQGNYTISVVTTELATIGKDVVTQIKDATGKNLGQPLRWLNGR
jgi:hypothetical protein